MPSSSPETSPLLTSTYVVDDDDDFLQPIQLQEQQRGYVHEFKWLLKNAMPLVISYLLQNTLQSFSIVSAGHLGANELASVTLGSMFVTISGLSVATGATLSLDTLCSQSFTSSKDKKLVGLHVQRCLAFMSFLYIPIIFLWWNSEKVFLLLRQDPVVAHLSSIYVRWMILAVPAFAIFEALKKMLQAQGIFNPPTYVLVVTTPVNLLLNYALVWIPQLSFGFHGAPIASCISYWLIVLLLCLYIFRIDGYQAWPSWSTSFVYQMRHWGPMIKLAIPGILLICTETWAYEIVALGASWIDTPNLGAQSIILTSITALYTLAFGVGIAAANRVGNLLGAQKPKQARMAARAALIVGTCVGFGNSFVLMLFRRVWAYLFTSDEKVVRIVAHVLPLVALFVIADNVAGVADGVLNGMGRQYVGAWCNLGSYYLSALPIGFYLCFKRGWKLSGIWTALAGSLIIAAAATLLVVLIANWKKEAQKAQKRTNGETSIPLTTAVRRNSNNSSLYEVDVDMPLTNKLG